MFEHNAEQTVLYEIEQWPAKNFSEHNPCLLFFCGFFFLEGIRRERKESSKGIIIDKKGKKIDGGEIPRNFNIFFSEPKRMLDFGNFSFFFFFPTLFCFLLLTFP